MPKRLYLFAPTLLAAATIATAQEPTPNAICISGYDSDAEVILLEENPVIIFDDESVIVKGKDINYIYPLSDFRSIDYVSTNTIGLTDIISDKIKIQGRQLVFPSSINNCTIYIYDLKGSCVLSKSIGEEYTIINLSSLPIGTYIVAVNDNSYKIQLHD